MGPRRTPIRTLCLSNPPIARTHVQATPRTTVGRSCRPPTPFFDDSSHPQHAHATRSGKHAADNVSLRDLRIETADGHLTPEINPRKTNSAQSIDRKRQPAKIPRELGPHPTPNTHTNTHTHPSPSAHNGRKTKARCNSSALSCHNDKVNVACTLKNVKRRGRQFSPTISPFIYCSWNNINGRSFNWD